MDDITDTRSDQTREAWGQGAANVVTGFFGGMGGCAMIGQTMINVKVSGARTRLSTFLAGVFLLALVAVMVMVSVGTFDSHLRHAGHPAPDAEVRDDRDGRERARHRADAQPRDRRGRGRAGGHDSLADLYTQFDYARDPRKLVIDLSEAHIWDASTVASLDAITKYRRKGGTVEIVGLAGASAERHERLTGTLT